VFNTFALFAKLGHEPQRVAVDAPSMFPLDAIIADSVRGESDLGAIATMGPAASRLNVLLWNYHDVAGGYDERRDVQLIIKGLAHAGRGARVVEYSIDENSGNAYTAWLAMGSPQSPTTRQIADLHAAARMRAVGRELNRTSAGEARLELVMPRQSVKLVVVDLPAGH
jgi:xylan 1,4-beta-xylosidase